MTSPTDPTLPVSPSMRDRAISGGEFPRRFGKFQLARHLGTGGFGTVYEAKQEDLGRTVALKILNADDPEALQRFVREAQTAGQLSHPGIVPIFEVGEHEGRHFISMQLIDGETLQRLRVEPRRAAELARDAAEAVHHAHERGIIHRDLKPHNMMLDRAGRVWVMDFGLARELRAGTTLTLTGSIMGTPAYMSPEQARGDKCDERSDVYSLGATLYDLLTGHPPFEGATPLEILDRVRLDDPVSPRKRNPRVPRDLETIALKAMEKLPARRYGSARDLAEDLRRHVAGEPILARPISMLEKGVRFLRRRAAAASIVALLLAGAAVGGGLWLRARIRLAAEVAELRQAGAADEAAGRYDEAIKRLQSIVAKDPSQEWAAGNIRELELRRDAERQKKEYSRKQAEARRILDGAVADRGAYAEARAQVPDLENRMEQLRSAIPTHEPADNKKPLWDAEKELEEARHRAEEVFLRLTGALAQAYGIGVEPERDEARRLLLDIYWEKYVEVERDGDRRMLPVWQGLIRQYDDAERSNAARLMASGTVFLDTNPTGADTFVFRYEEGDGRRWMPRPYNVLRRESRPPSSEETPETAYATELSDFNRLGSSPLDPMDLPQGSYLFIFRKPGFRDTRFPVLVTRGSVREARVTLYADEKIGKEFIYVPAGSFIEGGDRHAFQSAPRKEAATTGDLFISKYEISMGEYWSFLNDEIAARGAKEAQKRVPRESSDSGHYCRIPENATRFPLPSDWNPSWPVIGVSWEDAEAYCRWRTEQFGALERGWSYRLPSETEWEKAARGADGRVFPWGNHFDWSFAKGAKSRPGKEQIEPIGAFRQDESPYGLRDMAGSAREWCEDWFSEAKVHKVVRGGAWAVPDVLFMHAASRYNFEPPAATSDTGFRIVRLPPQK